MAKIFDRIDGYAEMSAEDKLKALEAMELEDNSSEIERLKNAVSKANSEAAGWKKKHNALLTDEQQKQQEQTDRFTQMQQELETLRKDKTVSEYTAKYVSLGFEEKLARETALAAAEGDMAKVFANQAKANEVIVKNAIAERLKSTPRGVGGTSGGVGGGMDYQKSIEEATARGDIAAVAYYTRLQAQEAVKNNQ